MTPLVVDNLKKTYQMKTGPAVNAVNGVSFEVGPGEVFGLLGPNGAGKTSIISIMTTLEKPTGGDVRIFGESVLQNPGFTKQNIGVVVQEVVNSGFFNLEEVLKYHSGYYGIKNNEKRINELLTRLNLVPHKHKLMRQLSGGMKRRMMIAKALVHSPKILLLDEPTAGVDVELRNDLWKFIRELQAEGVSIVLTTHYLQEAEELCDRVGIINKGELKFYGHAKDIIKKLTQKKMEVRTSSGSLVEFLVGRDDQIGDLLKSHSIQMSDIADIKTTEGSLEEAFIKVLQV